MLIIIIMFITNSWAFLYKSNAIVDSSPIRCCFWWVSLIFLSRYQILLPCWVTLTEYSPIRVAYSWSLCYMTWSIKAQTYRNAAREPSHVAHTGINMHNNLVKFCLRKYGHTNRHAHHNTPLPYRGRRGWFINFDSLWQWQLSWCNTLYRRYIYIAAV